MQHMQTLLQELDRLYHDDSLDAYEKQWQKAAKLVRHALQALPSLTLNCTTQAFPVCQTRPCAMC
jgi:hypothetical protein